MKSLKSSKKYRHFKTPIVLEKLFLKIHLSRFKKPLEKISKIPVNRSRKKFLKKYPKSSHLRTQQSFKNYFSFKDQIVLQKYSPNENAKGSYSPGKIS